MSSLECQICCCEFDECKHRPRILSCGHTFCSICLKKLLIEDVITCPNCQNLHAAENVENIKINYLIENLLSPNDLKAINLDTGYKCKEHYYELNFFCETHKEWICRDCTVIKHKPCSHSNLLSWDNETYCQVIPKKERLDIIKSEKIEEVKNNSEIYLTHFRCYVNEYRSELSEKLTIREDLKTRLKIFMEENDFEILCLLMKLNSSSNILSNIEEKKILAEVAKDEIIKAQRRMSVEETGENIEKIIILTHEWGEKEKNKILAEKKNITDVKITLKEHEELELKLCEIERSLSDSNDKIEELKSTTHHLKSQWKEQEGKILELEYKLKKKNELHVQDLSENILNKTKINNLKERVSELEKELSKNGKKCKHQENEKLKLKLSETEKIIFDCENEIDEHKSTTHHLKSQLKEFEYKLKNKNVLLAHDSNVKFLNMTKIENLNERISELERELGNSGENCKWCKNPGKDKDGMSVVETQELCEVKKHVLKNHCDVFLLTEISKGFDIKEHRFGQLHYVTYEKNIHILLEALQNDYPPPESLILQCRRMVPKFESADFVYLDIGKVEVSDEKCVLIGKPFGRLYIKLTTTPRRRRQMIRICSSIADEKWSFCNFQTIRNKGCSGELVTCKYYKKLHCEGLNKSRIYDTCDILFGDLKKIDEEHTILAGKVFGYLNDTAGFSIITRDNPSFDTRWPLLGNVVAGLDILKAAVIHHDINTIGIHSHGVGFPT
ncbi:unnamed protein product [Meganyctiphanes norvegica]|uniref:RING-type domain-containing protein n=1 Tax=Meganyctiphanes norvegica TaxID=48144 RepID=A0AAV2QZH5_MEGNR